MLPRKYQRIDHRIPATIYLNDRGEVLRHAGDVRDISAAGISLLTSRRCPSIYVGADVQLTIERMDGKRLKPLVGQVARAVRRKDGAYQLGIQFGRTCFELLVSLTSHDRIFIAIDLSDTIESEATRIGSGVDSRALNPRIMEQIRELEE